ncbi:lycopene beta-cyclase [Actimicrobium sp. GrIS 1.19]|uniref:lycopene cyclase family protein n=1 Tax=Actimicrobium sp. GrIS 1.19 TaxID=3071708 RepID=UPI002DFF2AFD|nr:lycopene beta-cyclase [Actimicrobium sp. GrIS 1.19]
MSADVDLLILGGGCAGLSLARELAAFGRASPSVGIIEQRVAYGNDRTWCFWGDAADPGTEPVEHQWRAVTLRAHGHAVTVDCSRHPYQMISARRFYDAALQTIALAPQIRLETGARIVAEPMLVNGLWQVETAAGKRRARQVIDTRPGAAPCAERGSPLLWQSFHGSEVTCEAPLFDPATATLMDFIDDGSHRIVFTYLLPMSATRALIELTVFSAAPVTAAELALPLQRQIRARVGSHPFKVERSEHGILPMGLVPEKTTWRANYLQVGLMHGAARASTGYAFQRIQRWARHCAAELANGAPAVGHAPDRMLMRGMDRLFLSLLRHRPDLAPTLFVRMFQHAAPDSLARFMSDRAALGDTLSLIAALPALPFIRQLGRNFLHAP